MPTEKETAAATETITTVNTPLPTLTVTLDQIEADESFNVRRNVDPGLYDKLKADIKANGVTNPLVVSRLPDGRYNLIAGFTRLRALTEIEKEARKEGGKSVPPVTVKVTVKDYPSEVEAHFDNVRDNMLRGELKPYDIAVKAQFLRDKLDQKGPTIARGLGLDRDYCNNLMRALDKLDPRIRDEWAAYNENATTAFLFSILTKEHDEQWERWLKKTGAWVEPGDEPTDPNATPPDPATPPKPARASMTTLESALAAVKKSDKPEDWKAGAMAALRFAMGGKRLADVYDPKKAQGGRTASKPAKAASAEA